MTVTEAAVMLNVSRERIQTLCAQGRLGYTVPRHGKAWVITKKEIEDYKAAGPRPAGRPKRRKENADD